MQPQYTDDVSQQLPVSQQLRDEVEKARQRLLSTKRVETAEQREALLLVAGDTLTRDQIDLVASAFSMSVDLLVELTNSVHDVGTPGGPG
jgi:hypothetical protein